MSFTFLNQLPTPAQIKEEYPLSKELTELKAKRDAMISDVICGKDDRFLVIIGPCSADNEDSVCDYVSRLTNIQEDVKDRVIIIPRVYTNKPRTTGEGYKGIASQPDPEKAPDMVEGLIAMRKMHIRAIAESGLTCADEMLYPENWGYVEDLLSYVAIGARSVEDQQHRLTVSGFDVASGMKNPTSGDFSVMLNSVYAAQHPHHFVYRGYEVETSGNPLTHVVLRGAVSKHGNTTTNYHYEDLIRLLYFTEEMMSCMKKDSVKGKTVVVSGSGNVAIYATEKAQELGAKVVALSDSNGYIYDPNGIKLDVVKQIKEVERGRIKEYVNRVEGATYTEGCKGIWTIKCDVALPCATQNEIDGESAEILLKNGVQVVAEGANMPSTPEAIDKFLNAGILFGPAKAANAGGVATSGLEMSQNSERLSWTFEEVDAKLKQIMINIFHNAYDRSKEYDVEGNLVVGANIAGFLKVADAMKWQGVAY